MQRLGHSFDDETIIGDGHAVRHTPFTAIESPITRPSTVWGAATTERHASFFGDRFHSFQVQ